MKSKQTNSKKVPFILYTNSFSSLGEKNNSAIDWDTDVDIPASLSSMTLPHISPAGKHVPLPYIPLS